MSKKSILDSVFSEWLRRSYADYRGFITCYCGRQLYWTQSDNSHFIKRGNLALRYDTRNCHPSCQSCNREKEGNIPVYTIFLKDKYGDDIIETLTKEARRVTLHYPYDEKIAEYKEKIKYLPKS